MDMVKTALKDIVCCTYWKERTKNRIDTSSRFYSRSPPVALTGSLQQNLRHRLQEHGGANVSSSQTQPLCPSQHPRLRCSSHPPIRRCSPCPVYRSTSFGSGVVFGGWTSADVSHEHHALDTSTTLLLLNVPSFLPYGVPSKRKVYMCAQRPTAFDNPIRTSITAEKYAPQQPHPTEDKEKKTHSYLIPSNGIPSQHLPAPQHHGRLMPPLPVLPHLVVAHPSRIFAR